MGVREILLEFLKDAEPSVRAVLTDVLMLEQRKIDSERPQVKSEIRQIIDDRVRADEAKDKMA